MVQRKGVVGNSWNPPVDIYELEDEIVLTVELPGIKQKDITLEMKDDILTLKGERKISEDVKEENFHIMERVFGSFERSFMLPSTVEINAIKASYNGGVLTVSLPKKKDSSKRKIKVNTA
jgi:HSP20 family protein